MSNVFTALLIRDFMSAYGRSPMAVLWAIAEPVIGIVILTIVFSQISSVPPMGSSYPLFYATGYLPFLVFTSIQAKVMSAVKQSKNTLEHASVSFIDVIFARAALQSLIMFTVSVLIFAGIWLIYSPPERADIPLMMGMMALTAFIATGIGCLNAGIESAFEPWGKVWGVVQRPLFLISGVFYPFAAMPPSLQDVLWWNPVLHLVGMSRDAVYQGYEAGYVSVLFVFAVGIVAMMIGLALLLVRKK